MHRDKRWELFECQRCGRCCAGIGLPYDPNKILDITQYLDITIDQAIEKYYGQWTQDRKGWISEDLKRKPCPFLMLDGEEKICEIYPVRPLGCRLYPFETDGGRQGVYCPGSEITYAMLLEEE